MCVKPCHDVPSQYPAASIKQSLTPIDGRLKSFLLAVLLLGSLFRADTASAWSVNSYLLYQTGLPDAYSAAELGCSHHSATTRIAAISFTSIEPATATVVCENYSGGQWWYWRAPFIASEPGDLGYFMDARNFDTEDKGKADVCSGNPINLLNGNKYKIYTDIDSETPSGLSRPGFTRYYNSQSSVADTTIGNKWSHSYDRRIVRHDALKQKINIELDSSGATSDVYQSSVYSTRQAACESGLAEVVAKTQALDPAPFANLKGFANATAQWVDNECQIYDNGRFRAVFPIRSHGGIESGGNSWDHHLNFHRPDGKIVKFRKIMTLGWYTHTVEWEPELPSGYKLEQIDVTPPPGGGVNASQVNYLLTTPDDVLETYDSSGRLLTVDYPNGTQETLAYQNDQLDQVINSLGQSLDFQYNLDGLIEYVTDDANRTWEYRYTGSNLAEVVKPDATSVKYHYEDSNFPSGLTGVTDERNVRRSTFEYHADGLAKSSYLGPPGALPSLKIENVDVSYAALSNTVTNSRGFQSTYHFSGDVLKGLMTQYDGPECIGCAGGSSNYVYDIDPQSPRGSTLNLLSSTEYGLNVSYENHDEDGNPGIVTEAVGTAEQRTTTYTYDARFPGKVATETEPSVYVAGSKVTTYAYDNYAGAGITDQTWTVSMPTTPGDYEFRLFLVDDNTQAGVSEAVTVEAEPYAATLTPSTTAAAPGEAVTVTLADSPGGAQDWLALAQVGAPATSYVTYTYVGGGVTDRTWTVNMPTTPGEYEFRLFLNNGYTQAGLSAPVTVGAGEPEPEPATATLTPSTTAAAPGEAVTVSIADSLDSAQYRLALAQVGASATSYVAYTYVTVNMYDKPTAITVGGYRPDGTPVSRSQTFTYNGPYRQISAIDGPRTDVTDITTIDYYPDDPLEGDNRARMKKITAPLGVVLYDNITYTATGKQASYTTGSNLQVTLTYYPGNDRPQTQTLTDTSSGKSRTTRWTYTPTGQVASITHGDATPEATTLTFAYDDADRLTRIYDGLGNYLEYTLDTEGNVTNESIYDNADGLQKALNQTFDAYDRLDIATQANETRNRDFAPNGTLDQETDGKNVITDYSYDALRRLTAITQDLGGTDPSSANALTQLGYDVQDNLTSVTDPNGGQTSYVYDDLGNLLSLTSPDTGTTLYTHDEAGNMLSVTDAKGQVFNYSYDALGRLLAVDAPGTADDITYGYDSCSNGAVRLCSVTNATATVTYAYTAFGDIKQVDQTINADQGYAQSQSQLAYTYDAAGRLQDVIYPSGAKITYTRDTAGNVYSVILNDGENNLVTGTTYYPFGPASATTRGNGSVIIGQRDSAYRLSMIGDTSTFYDVINYDANGNPATFSSSEGAKTHDYDALDRLDTSAGPYGSRDYDYDANGNRVLLDDGAATGYNYTANSNRMTQAGGDAVQLDANGNTLSVGSRTYTYTAHNRLYDAFDNTTFLATYTYNGLSERVGKYTSTGGQRFMFDPDGKLVAEIDLLGNVTREYVYMNDELLALIEPGSPASTILYVHNDHLGTPHMLTDESGVAVWSAVYDPFGLAAVDEDLDGDGYAVALNVRFPGQYYEGESGLHYNYFRYYDPETGRYITSDPIGLAGGANTYSYVKGNPLISIDPMGLLEVSLYKEQGGDSKTVQMGGEGSGIPATDILYNPSGINATKVLPNIPGSLTIKPGISGVDLEYTNRSGIEIKLEVEDERMYGSCKISF